jgi:AbrB family looped-hinge helix DNA binding protein
VTVTLSAKNQIVIPREAREALRVKPGDKLVDEQRVDEFYALLSTYPNLDWAAPNLEIADLAARLRALYRLRAPDALQAATAVHVGATAFITNDAIFERVEGFEVLVLERL